MVTKKTSTGKTAPAPKKVSIAAIQKRAEKIYLKRMKEGTPGDAESDWHQAEKELKK